MQRLSKIRPLEAAKSAPAKGYNVPSEGVIIIIHYSCNIYLGITSGKNRHRRRAFLRRFILQGETEESFSENERSTVSKSAPSQNSCSFELEVCLLEIGTNDKRLVGIRRKRLKGDAWVYKRVCEEILALTAGDNITTDPEGSSESKFPI